MDEDCLDPALAKVLGDRGHEVVAAFGDGRTRGMLSRGAKDEDVAALADHLEAVLVTCNHRHFEVIIARAPAGNRQLFRHAGRVSLLEKGRRAVVRLAQAIALIEAESAILSRETDRRVIVEISSVAIRFVR